MERQLHRLSVVLCWLNISHQHRGDGHGISTHCNTQRGWRCWSNYWNRGIGSLWRVERLSSESCWHVREPKWPGCVGWQLALWWAGNYAQVLMNGEVYIAIWPRG